MGFWYISIDIIDCILIYYFLKYKSKYCCDEWKINIVMFKMFRDLMFLYCSLKDILFNYIKIFCYDIFLIIIYNVMDVIDLVK